MNNNEWYISDSEVESAILTVENIASQYGVEGTLVGGMANQRWLYESLEGEMPDRDIKAHLRDTSDIDMAFTAPDEAEFRSFLDHLFDPSRGGIDGKYTDTGKGYTGHFNFDDERLGFNANLGSTGIEATNEEIVGNSERMKALTTDGDYNVIGLEDLVHTKLSGIGEGRSKDYEDSVNLLRRYSDEIDFEYVESRLDDEGSNYLERIREEHL